MGEQDITFPMDVTDPSRPWRFKPEGYLVVILTGISLPDDGLHSPNEKLDLAQLWTGIRVFGRFFELFAERGGSAEEEVQERTDRSEAQEGGAEQEAMETV